MNLNENDELCFQSKKIKNYLISKNINLFYQSKSNSNEDDREKLLNKIKHLEKIILNELNTKLEVNLTGEEIKINLNGKKIGNLDLKLLALFITKI